MHLALRSRGWPGLWAGEGFPEGGEVDEIRRLASVAVEGAHAGLQPTGVACFRNQANLEAGEVRKVETPVPVKVTEHLVLRQFSIEG